MEALSYLESIFWQWGQALLKLQEATGQPNYITQLGQWAHIQQGQHLGPGNRDLLV